MKVLALDTASKVSTVAIIEDNKLIGEFTVNSSKTHSKMLMPIIDEVLKYTETELDEIDYIAVSSGPGSFTGLRIGAATVKGIAHGKNIPIIGVPTLDGLAHNVIYTDMYICPIIDAKRNEVFAAIYKSNKEKINMISEHELINIDELMFKLEELDSDIIFVGDAVEVQQDRIKELLGEKAIFGMHTVNMQKASSIGLAAFEYIDQGIVNNYINFEPIYLKKSQAEIEREDNERKKSN
ncbi:MAG: tRNA (adenosine(37)-N6)-threonylcarbamoyltransferase complex dimerization subunit type 1 TsaB [Clostridia bacterium]|nr:tRNA (adenosine(37)-N6)-threonylcarbamoyltransferase complex dimerization subunit type 1 TsaB [Clostridia bacterium]